MWSILTDALPEYISVGDDAIWRVNTDYRIWLRVGQLLSEFDPESSAEAQEKLIRDLHDLILPEGEKIHGKLIWAGFVEAVSKFYAGPQPDKKEPDEPEPARPKPKRQFDFSWDAGFIYQSFVSFYHIRLCETEMHWWEFLTLFNGLMLNDNNSMNFILGVRQRKIGDVPSAQRAAYWKMKKEFALPDPEKENALLNHAYSQLEALWSENNG